VQLAAALAVHATDPSLTLLSADTELNIAATAERLTVDDPNSHPMRLANRNRSDGGKGVIVSPYNLFDRDLARSRLAGTLAMKSLYS
jgi:hypothetical protein